MGLLDIVGDPAIHLLVVFSVLAYLALAACQAQAQPCATHLRQSGLVLTTVPLVLQ